MTIKTHQNYSGLLYLHHKHRVKKIREIHQSGEKLWKVEISQKWGVCVKKGYDYTDISLSLSREHIFAKYDLCLKRHNFCSIIDRDFN